jgi:hypothetical protein
MHAPNADLAIYIPPNGAPNAPDLLTRAHFGPGWRVGIQVNEFGRSHSHTFEFTDIIEVLLGTDIRDSWPLAPGNFVYSPDQNGQQYLVVFVETEREFKGKDYLKVYLQRTTWGAVAMEVKQANGNPDYLNITVLVIDQATGLTLTQPGPGQAEIHYDSKLLCSATDTTRDYLENKLSPGTKISITLQNGGGNEDLLISWTGQNWVRQRVLYNAF